MFLVAECHSWVDDDYGSFRVLRAGGMCNFTQLLRPQNRCRLSAKKPRCCIFELRGLASARGFLCSRLVMRKGGEKLERGWNQSLCIGCELILVETSRKLLLPKLLSRDRENSRQREGVIQHTNNS